MINQHNTQEKEKDSIHLLIKCVSSVICHWSACSGLTTEAEADIPTLMGLTFFKLLSGSVPLLLRPKTESRKTGCIVVKTTQLDPGSLGFPQFTTSNRVVASKLPKSQISSSSLHFFYLKNATL